MKKLQLTTILLVALSMNVFSQTWKAGITNPNPNFIDIQKAFYDNYKPDTAEHDGDAEEKDGEVEKFKRWEWYWGQRVGQSGVFPPANILWTEFETYNLTHSS